MFYLPPGDSIDLSASVPITRPPIYTKKKKKLDLGSSNTLNMTNIPKGPKYRMQWERVSSQLWVILD